MEYDIDLVYEISKGLRETPISHTPDEYIDIYTRKLFLCLIIEYLKY